MVQHDILAELIRDFLTIDRAVFHPCSPFL